MSRRPMICLSPHYWEGSWFRKQQFMLRFAQQGHRVLYIEPSHSVVRLTGPDGRTANPLLFSTISNVAPNVWTLRPPRLYPKPRVPWVSELNQRRILRAAKRAADNLGMREPIWWVYPPAFAPAVLDIPSENVVFDLVDDLEGYATNTKRATYRGKCVRNLAQHAGSTICTSRPLEKHLLAMGASPKVVPNGFDPQLFKASLGTATSHNGGTERPVIGFVGTLFDFLDFDLLIRVAVEIPSADLVLVGRIESRQPAVASLIDLPNVRHMDAVPRHEVPAIIDTFDVCLAPFNQGRVAASVSPLKVYEYLAMHKPVICTPMQGLQQEPVAAFIDFADSAVEFVSLTRKRLDRWSVDMAALDDVLADSTWDARFDEVCRHLGHAMLEQ